MEVPRLETERLILRAHAMEDFPAYAAMWADPVVSKHFPAPLSEEDAWAKFLRLFGQWELFGYGNWSVHDRKTGERLGETGFFEARRDIEPCLIGTPEAGWSFAAAAHGKGYATEAVAAAHRWADDRFGKARTCCIIVPANTPSIRVADRMGYKELAQTTYKTEPINVYYRDPA
jgi:RimJ/RimL family protein N-acetyltransferase